MRIYLASQSPRRAELLTQIGVAFDLLLPQSAVQCEQAEALEALIPGEDAPSYVQRVTRLKAEAAYARWQGLQAADAATWPAQPILCADTTVALDAEILAKPSDAADAARMLRLLSGREHDVLTALVVVTPDGQFLPALAGARVRLKALSEAEISAYIASGEPMGKAGSYAIQGRAGAFVQHLTGSYSAIVGLPLFETAALLAQAQGRAA